MKALPAYPSLERTGVPTGSCREKGNIGAHDPFLTGWDSKVTTDGVPKHRPSEILKRELMGFLSGYGHEDIMQLAK
jgi:hypothetical protein